MPELYPGQSGVVAAKLREAELIQERDEELLRAESDPIQRSKILQRLAGRVQIIAGYSRQLDKCEGGEPSDATGRDRTIRFRLTESEESALRTQAAEAGQTLSQYIRMMLGL